MPSNDYHFRHHWYIEGTLEEVARVLSSAPDLARWWPSTYLDVQVLEPGDERHLGEVGSVYAKGWLPYRIRFKYRITETHYLHGFAVDAWGDLTGHFKWRFDQEGPVVHMVYDWIVRADKPLLRMFSFILKPLFRSNHNWTMRLGEESLKLELARRRARTPEERASIPPPPNPPTMTPLQAGLAGLGLVGGAVWLATRHKATLRVEYSTLIQRPVTEVFAFVTQVDNDLRWQPEIEAVEITSDGPLGVGSTFREVRTTLGQKFVWNMRITEIEPPHRICIVSDGGTIPYQGCRTFEAVEGGTRVTETSEVQLVPWLRPFNIQLARASRRSVAEAYTKLKSILDSGP